MSDSEPEVDIPEPKVETPTAKARPKKVMTQDHLIIFYQQMIIVFTPCLEEILIVIMNVSKNEMNFIIIIIKKAMNSTKRERSNIVSFN